MSARQALILLVMKNQMLEPNRSDRQTASVPLGKTRRRGYPKMDRPMFQKALGLVLAVLGAPILGLLLATAGVPVWPSTLIALVAGFWFYLAWEKTQ